MVRLKLTSNNAGAIWDEVVIVVYGKPPYKTRPNQSTVVTLSGIPNTFDRGNTIVKGALRIRRLSPAQKASLSTFIEETSLFNLHKFSLEITAIAGGDTEGIDLGLGEDNTSLVECSYGDEYISTQDMFEHKAPNIYHCVLPYRYVMSQQV